MTNPQRHENAGHVLDYQLSSVPGSRLQFRGPLPSLDEPFVAVLGGSETFGKFVSAPYPALLSEWINMPVANLGIAQAGLSLFSDEPVLLDIASKAEVTVFQVLGAQNMSNRLYSVHPRRNDRFLGVSPALRELFPQVDFAEINFTGHLLSRLQEISPSDFDVLVEELKWAWVQRMRRILSIIRGDVVLLWISDRSLDAPPTSAGFGEPSFVDVTMIDELREAVAGVAEVVLDNPHTLDGKIIHEGEGEAAAKLPGPNEHSRITEALIGSMDSLGHSRAPQDTKPEIGVTAFRSIPGRP